MRIFPYYKKKLLLFIWIKNGTQLWTYELFIINIWCLNYNRYKVKSESLMGRNLVSILVVQSLSHIWLFVTPWTAAHEASLSITTSRSLLKLMTIELVMPSNHFIFYHPLLLPSSTLPSIRVFSKELTLCIRWPKYWSFSFSIGPSNEYSRLISFRMDWLDLLAVQGSLKSLLQHHRTKT